MPTRDEEHKVRPIDLTAVGTPESTRQETPRRAESDGPRPWIPLLVSLFAVTLVAGAVAAFGALEFDDPPAAAPGELPSGSRVEPESATETLPPRLDESLPNLTDRLTLVAAIDGTLQTLLWDPSFRVPKPYDLPIGVVADSSRIQAVFDSGGRTLAVGVTTPLTTEVYVGIPTDIGAAPDIVDTTSWLWHATEVGSIAWIGLTDDHGFALYTGTVDPLSGTIANTSQVVAFDTPASLVRWDSAGFVLNRDGLVTALDSSGATVWETKGTSPTASKSILLVSGEDFPTGTFVDRYSGETAMEAVRSIPLDPDSVVTMSRMTDLIAVTVETNGRTRILVDGPGIATKRIVQIDAAMDHIEGFSSSGEYLIFEPQGSNDIVFVDWRTGATHTLPIPDEWIVFGVDLG